MPKFFYLSRRKSPTGSSALRRAWRPSGRAVQFFALAGIIVFGVGSLVQINSLSVKGYEIRQLEQTIHDLKQESTDLEQQVHELQSVGRVEGQVDREQFVAVKNPEFLSPTPVALVR